VAAVVLVGAIVLISGGRDDTSTRTTAVATPTASATETPAPTATKAPAHVRRVSGGDVAYTVPSTDGWALSAPQRGALTIRRLTGPDGELIRIVHSPGIRAEPVASAVVSEAPFATPSVPDARKFVLRDFPSDRCAQRRCDDYVLNDDAFGGLAILASDAGGPASRVAAKIARTVTARSAPRDHLSTSGVDS
jgi:hypothetical protein